LAEHRSGISQVGEYIFRVKHRESTVQFLNNINPDTASLTASRLKHIAGY
jgi:hypothetical protein